VLSKRVPILIEGTACNQDPDSLHYKALKRAKSLGELKIKSLAIIPLIFHIPPSPGGTAILPEYIHYYG
jgi:hypothetical protein